MLNFFYRTDQESPDRQSSSDLPDHILDFSLPFARSIWTEGPFGGILNQQIIHGQYGINVTDFLIEKSVTLYARATQPVVAFVLPVAGSLTCNSQKSKIIMQQFHCYAVNMSHRHLTEFKFPRGKHRLFFFTLSIPLWMSYAKQFTAIRELKKIVTEQFAIDAQNLETPFSLRTEAILHDIENYTATGDLHDYMLTRITEFLANYSKILLQPREERVHHNVLLKTFAERLIQVRGLIDEHEGRPLTIEQLAKKAGINAKQLKPGFRNMFGVTIGRYQLIRRMQQAARLLINTSNTIELISDLVGYDESSSFARRFKPIYKMTPLQYRIMHKEGQDKNHME